MYCHFAILLLFGPFTGLRLLDSTIIPHEICIQAANAIDALISSYREIYSLRRTHSFMPYISLASGIVHLAVADPHGSNVGDIFTKVLQGVSNLHEMALSHAFADRGKEKLRNMANYSMVESNWLESDKEKRSYPNEDSSYSFRNAENILPRCLDVSKSSIFSPYPSQILARSACNEELRLNGFELITSLPWILSAKPGLSTSCCR
jgi:hypothetical protein